MQQLAWQQAGFCLLTWFHVSVRLQPGPVYDLLAPKAGHQPPAEGAQDGQLTAAASLAHPLLLLLSSCHQPRNNSAEHWPTTLEPIWIAWQSVCSATEWCMHNLKYDMPGQL